VSSNLIWNERHAELDLVSEDAYTCYAPDPTIASVEVLVTLCSLCICFLNCDYVWHIVNFAIFFMKWLRYQRVISLQTQVGSASQRNEWANTDPRTYWRWDKYRMIHGKICITPPINPRLQYQPKARRPEGWYWSRVDRGVIQILPCIVVLLCIWKCSDHKSPIMAVNYDINVIYSVTLDWKEYCDVIHKRHCDVIQYLR
jgi:hypothetical protein